MDARTRARYSSRIVEGFGFFQVAVGAVIGIWLMFSVDYPCLEFRESGTCARYAYAWEVDQWWTGVVVILASIIYGSFIVMAGAYVGYRTSTDH